MANQSEAQQQLTGQLVLMQAELSQLRVTVREIDKDLKVKDEEIDRWDLKRFLEEDRIFLCPQLLHQSG